MILGSRVFLETHPLPPLFWIIWQESLEVGILRNRIFKKLTPCPLSLKEREGVSFPKLIEPF